MDEDILEKAKSVKAELTKEKYLVDTALDPVRTHTDETDKEIRRLRVRENQLLAEVLYLQESRAPLEADNVRKSDRIEELVLKYDALVSRLEALVGPPGPLEDEMPLIDRVEAAFAKVK